MKNEKNPQTKDETKLFEAKLVLDQKLDKKFAVKIQMDQISSKVEDGLKKMQPDFTIKGFRKGKVPLEILRKYKEGEILSEVSQRLFSDVVNQILLSNAYKPASTPKINIEKFDGVSDVEISIEIELMPEVPEIEFSKIELVNYEITPNEQEIQDSLNRILSNHKEWKLVEDTNYAIKNGDSARIDYNGKVDGKEFSGGAAKDHDLEIGSKSFIDNFEEQLVGKKVGDELTVSVTFPSPYHEKSLAGKKAEFDVKINCISIAQKQELNDDFVKKNIGLESLEELRRKVKSDEIASFEYALYELKRKRILDYFEKSLDFEVPKSLIESYYNGLWQEIEEQLKNNPSLFENEEAKEAKKIEIQNRAKKMAMILLTITDIGSKNNIFVSKQDWEVEIEKLARMFGGNMQIVSQIFEKNHKAKEERKAALHEKKIIEFISSKCSAKNQNVSTSELRSLLASAS